MTEREAGEKLVQDLAHARVDLDRRMEVLKLAFKIASDKGPEAVLDAYGKFMDRLTENLPDGDEVETARSRLIPLFLTDRCVLDPAREAGAGRLYEEFANWHAERGEDKTPSHVWFGRQMRRLFHVRHTNYYFYLGLGLKNV